MVTNVNTLSQYRTLALYLKMITINPFLMKNGPNNISIQEAKERNIKNWSDKNNCKLFAQKYLIVYPLGML